MTPDARRALRASVGAAVAMAAVGCVSLLAGEPLLFPAIGASAFLAFAFRDAPLARLRHALAGHALGLASGSAAAWAFGVQPGVAWLEADVPGRAVAASVVSLGVATGAMLLLRVPHPPAGATTLIFACGLLAGPTDAAAVLASVLLLVLVVRALDRAWPEQPAGGGPRASEVG